MLRRRSLGQCSWVNVWLSIMWVGVRAYGYRWTCLVLVTRRVLHALVSFPRAFCFRMQCSCDVQRRVLPNAYDYVVLWPLGPAFSESGHAFSLIKCYSRELKMKPRVVDYFGNLRRLFWKLTISQLGKSYARRYRAPLCPFAEKKTGVKRRDRALSRESVLPKKYELDFWVSPPINAH